jgi:hypothetical protein
VKGFTSARRAGPAVATCNRIHPVQARTGPRNEEARIEAAEVALKVPKVLVRAKERAEPVVRNFEWTWTTAVVFSLAFAFFSVITMAVIPSFWLYFAEQKLGWGGLSGTTDWQPLARDFVAVNLAMGPFVTVIVIGAIMQNWRRKLRGGSSDRPTGGYR